ncbi:MAG: hypothetical protein HQM09_03125 [Candidatus Riflebacteria bacterium]|nr:hypothetical protein [Candidatus Riflebacteria bacterium]
MHCFHSFSRFSAILFLALVVNILGLCGCIPLLAESPSESTAANDVLLLHEPTHFTDTQTVAASDSDSESELSYRVSTALARLQARKELRKQKTSKIHSPSNIQTPIATEEEPKTEFSPVIQNPSLKQHTKKSSSVDHYSERPADEAVATEITVKSPVPVHQSELSKSVPAFSHALSKMERMRENRLKQAQQLKVMLPSQGGSIENASKSLYKMNQHLHDLINRIG